MRDAGAPAEAPVRPSVPVEQAPEVAKLPSDGQGPRAPRPSPGPWAGVAGQGRGHARGAGRRGGFGAR